MRRSVILFIVLTGLFCTPQLIAQTETLQSGFTIDRALARGETHTFNVNLEADQFLQLVVTQRGIDVIIRAFDPDGKSLGEFDSPNGSEGTEPVAIVSVAAGVYRFEVTPLSQTETLAPGRYEIKIIEQRKATDQELMAGKNAELLKARGMALLSEVASNVSQIRLPQTRVRAQITIAQLLAASDEKQAAKVANEAAENVKEYIANIDVLDQDYYQTYELAMQLRAEVVQVLGPLDPEAALAFVRATRSLSQPHREQWNRELGLELSLASQLSNKDPKRAVQLAEESLKQGYSNGLLELVMRLRVNEPELAARLARQIATRLQQENLLTSQEVSNVAVNLLRAAHSPVRRFQSARTAPVKTDIPILTEQEYKALFDKVLADALSYKGPVGNFYSPEKNAAQTLLNSLRSMTPEMTANAPSSIALVEKKTTELNSGGDPQSAQWEKYQQTINSGTIEEALAAAAQAPRHMREQLYQQVAQTAANKGDVARGRQIVKENIQNPQQRQQALAQIEQQAIYLDMNKGRIEEALRGVANLRGSRERAMMLSQLVNQIGTGQKRATAIELLELARSLVGNSARVENNEQMAALTEIARVFSRYDPKRAFEIVEPLIDQFNEMTAAALVLNNFGQQYYQDGELILQNGNNVANVATQLMQAFGTLGRSNFDRAKADADRLDRIEVRINAYLAIAQQAMAGDPTDRRFMSRRSIRQ